ncbi:hypothetical protein [Chamaesiphon sp. OTE_20_metabat_361]|uniref:hypothetical protein n=1 Tax=Chamaesiphon sp. OTE_20_metabat_361 TaxID=2964689 RepID=UPI00286A8089|nr:hypothetical protein [Chamaesiphon sp. OTE_20_metabat_361]
MAKLIGSQLSLIAESDFEYRSIGDWDYDELGTEIFLVPNSRLSELGTKKLDDADTRYTELGTEIFLVPNSDNWKPPVGCLQQKWVKDHQYWYWRYYKLNGKKASKYLHKDYNKAVRKAMKIGIPIDAKLPKSITAQTDPQICRSTTENIVDIAQTARTASRAA